MDDRHAQFLIIVADICLGTALARLEVQIETVNGQRITGTPDGDLREAALCAAEIDSDSTVRIGGHELRLGDIAACSVHAPANR